MDKKKKKGGRPGKELEIREEVAKRLKHGLPLSVRKIAAITGGSFSTIMRITDEEQLKWPHEPVSSEIKPTGQDTSVTVSEQKIPTPTTFEVKETDKGIPYQDLIARLVRIEDFMHEASYVLSNLDQTYRKMMTELDRLRNTSFPQRQISAQVKQESSVDSASASDLKMQRLIRENISLMEKIRVLEIELSGTRDGLEHH